MVGPLMDLLAHEYLQRALLAGLIVALTAPLLGLFLVLKRLSLIGDTLSHTAFAGIAIGAFLHLAPFWTALGVTMASSLGIAKMRQSKRVAGDAALAVFFSLGLALGIFLISLSPSFPFSLTSLLFGSLLLVGPADLLTMAIIGSMVALVVLLFLKELVHIALDEELALASGLPVGPFNYLLSLLTGMMVIAAMRVVGILLVSALLVMPALTALQVARSFKESLWMASLLGALSVTVGLSLAVALDAAPGGSIVLVAILLLLLSMVGKGLVRRSRRRSAL